MTSKWSYCDSDSVFFVLCIISINKKIKISFGLIFKKQKLCSLQLIFFLSSFYGPINWNYSRKCTKRFHIFTNENHLTPLFNSFL